MNCQKEKTNINSLENFTELVENDIFKPNNQKRIKNNISIQERNALKDIQRNTSKTCRTQDKGSRFVVLDSSKNANKTRFLTTVGADLSRLLTRIQVKYTV